MLFFPTACSLGWPSQGPLDQLRFQVFQAVRSNSFICDCMMQSAPLHFKKKQAISVRFYENMTKEKPTKTRKTKWWYQAPSGMLRVGHQNHPQLPDIPTIFPHVSSHHFILTMYRIYIFFCVLWWRLENQVMYICIFCSIHPMDSKLYIQPFKSKC